MKNHGLNSDGYDTIIVGSGMGGLSTASLLAQIGKHRVLVLSRTSSSVVFSIHSAVRTMSGILAFTTLVRCTRAR